MNSTGLPPCKHWGQHGWDWHSLLTGLESAHDAASRQGARAVCAVCRELVQGSPLGAVPPCRAGHCLLVDVQRWELFCAECSDYVYSQGFDRALQTSHAERNYVQRGVPVSIPSNDPAPQVKAARQRLAAEHGHCLPAPSGSVLEQRKELMSLASQDGLPLGLRGLNNLGNTCFMNSVLQALLHAPLVRNYFLGDGHSPASCRRKGPRSCLSCELDTVFMSMYSGERQPFSPVDFLYSWWTQDDHLAEYQQQDAHEFYLSALSYLSQAVISAPAPPAALGCTEEAGPGGADSSREGTPLGAGGTTGVPQAAGLGAGAAGLGRADSEGEPSVAQRATSGAAGQALNGGGSAYHTAGGPQGASSQQQQQQHAGLPPKPWFPPSAPWGGAPGAAAPGAWAPHGQAPVKVERPQFSGPTPGPSYPHGQAVKQEKSFVSHAGTAPAALGPDGTAAAGSQGPARSGAAAVSGAGDSFCSKGGEQMDQRGDALPLVESVFGGLLRSDVTCRVCGHTSTAYDPFLDISLDMGAVAKAAAAATSGKAPGAHHAQQPHHQRRLSNPGSMSQQPHPSFGGGPSGTDPWAAATTAAAAPGGLGGAPLPAPSSSGLELQRQRSLTQPSLSVGTDAVSGIDDLAYPSRGGSGAIRGQAHHQGWGGPGGGGSKQAGGGPGSTGGPEDAVDPAGRSESCSLGEVPHPMQGHGAKQGGAGPHGAHASAHGGRAHRGGVGALMDLQEGEGSKRPTPEASDDSQPWLDAALAGVGTAGHKRQRTAGGHQQHQQAGGPGGAMPPPGSRHLHHQQHASRLAPLHVPGAGWQGQAAGQGGAAGGPAAGAAGQGANDGDSAMQDAGVGMLPPLPELSIEAAESQMHEAYGAGAGAKGRAAAGGAAGAGGAGPIGESALDDSMSSPLRAPSNMRHASLKSTALAAPKHKSQQQQGGPGAADGAEGQQGAGQAGHRSIANRPREISLSQGIGTAPPAQALPLQQKAHQVPDLAPPAAAMAAAASLPTPTAAGPAAVPGAATAPAPAPASGKGKAASKAKPPAQPRVTRCGQCHTCLNKYLKKACLRNKALKEGVPIESLMPASASAGGGSGAGSGGASQKAEQPAAAETTARNAAGAGPGPGPGPGSSFAAGAAAGGRPAGNVASKAKQQGGGAGVGPEASSLSEGQTPAPEASTLDEPACSHLAMQTEAWPVGQGQHSSRPGHDALGKGACAAAESHAKAAPAPSITAASNGGLAAGAAEGGIGAGAAAGAAMDMGAGTASQQQQYHHYPQSSTQPGPSRGGHEPKALSLAACLRHLVQPESLTIDDAWVCSHCRRRQPASKQMSIRRAPPVLCLHLKRFENAPGSTRVMRKLQASISFPLDCLDLGPYLTATVLRQRYMCRGSVGAAGGSHPEGKEGGMKQELHVKQEPGLAAVKQEEGVEAEAEAMGPGAGGTGLPHDSCRYRLFAVVCHKGDITGGHYIAYVREGGHWFCCDDAWVTLVDEEEVAHSQAYMLFFCQDSFHGDGSMLGL